MSAGALDPARLASLEALVDRLLPGAREAGVAAYVDRALAGAYASECDAYTAGLDAIDRKSVV